jgi:hypothetical protein
MDLGKATGGWAFFAQQLPMLYSKSIMRLLPDSEKSDALQALLA